MHSSKMKEKPFNFYPVLLPLCLIALFASVLVTFADSSYPQVHMIPEFWDEEINYSFVFQKTNVSCVPASVHMMLKSLRLEPLPSQEELAEEMKTDINHTTQWRFTYIPFANRDFKEFQNRSLSENRDLALHHLKEHTSKDYRILIITWFSETEKELDEITHARVITGYNETGIFFHDPLSGPNMYLHNSNFIELWDTDYGYWALIIEQGAPRKAVSLLAEWVRNNLDIVALLIVGLVVEVHYVSRISNFTNSIALLLFFSRKEIPSGFAGFLIFYVCGARFDNGYDRSHFIHC